MFRSTPCLTGHRHDEPIKLTSTICIVDPQLDDYRGWSATANARHVRVHFCITAEEALRLSLTTHVDLWVVNTELPGLSGYELCNMLKTRSSHAAVYLVANKYSTEAEREALRNRATLFGCKGSHTVWLDQWLLQRDAALSHQV